jgi:hypothetical protein
METKKTIILKKAVEKLHAAGTRVVADAQRVQ